VRPLVTELELQQVEDAFQGQERVITVRATLRYAFVIRHHEAVLNHTLTIPNTLK
jgi:hypothetical protein